MSYYQSFQMAEATFSESSSSLSCFLSCNQSKFSRPDPEIGLFLQLYLVHLQLEPPSLKEASNPGSSSSAPGFPFPGTKTGVKPAVDQGSSDALRSNAGHLAPSPATSVMREADISLPVKGLFVRHEGDCRRVHLVYLNGVGKILLEVPLKYFE